MWNTGGRVLHVFSCCCATVVGRSLLHVCPPALVFDWLDIQPIGAEYFSFQSHGYHGAQIKDRLPRYQRGSDNRVQIFRHTQVYYEIFVCYFRCDPLYSALSGMLFSILHIRLTFPFMLLFSFLFSLFFCWFGSLGYSPWQSLQLSRYLFTSSKHKSRWVSKNKQTTNVII